MNENEEYWEQSDLSATKFDTFFDDESDTTDESLAYIGQSGYSKTHSEKSVNFVKSPVEKNASASILDNISKVSDISISSTPVSFGKKEKVFRDTKNHLQKSSFITRLSSNKSSASCQQCIEKEVKIKDIQRRLDTAYSHHTIHFSPTEVVSRITLGLSFSLEPYKCLEDKLALIDAALESWDTSALMVTILHLRNTIKKGIFEKEIKKRPRAAASYITYLKRKHSFTEVADFLYVLGRREEAALLRYEVAGLKLHSQTHEAGIHSLKMCYQSNYAGCALSHESVIKDHIQLLEYQKTIDDKDSKDSMNVIFQQYPRVGGVFCRSLLTTLFYCAMYHWEKSSDMIFSPIFLHKTFQIPNKQFLWTVIRARAKVKHWPLPPELDALVSVQGVLSSLGSIIGANFGRGVKSHLPVEQVVEVLAASGAPPNVLASYIALLDSTETRLKVALLYKCHQAVIEGYIAQKDRASLERYMSEIPPGSPDYLKADHVLKSGKWKS